MKNFKQAFFLSAVFGMGCAGSSIEGTGIDASTTSTADASVLFGDVSPDAPVLPGGGGFDPTINGFSFENFANTINLGDAGTLMVTNMTAAEMYRLFGDSVCETGTGDACVLTTQGQAWMDDKNTSLAVGHCEGFSILSLLMQQQYIQPSNFMPGATRAFDLPVTIVPLQRELALWAASQWVEPVVDSAKLPANQVVSNLQGAFMPNSHDVAILEIFKADGTGGHAVAPISVVAPGAGGANTADINLYDNNYPGVTQTLHITDLGTGAWNYVAQQNPGLPPSTYSGDDATNQMYLSNVGSRIALPSSCFFCGNYVSMGMTAAPQPSSVPMPTTAPGTRQINVTGVADLLLVDGMGRQLGVSSGTLVNQIPGAETIRIAGIDPTQQTGFPSFTVPEGIALKATLTPSPQATATPTLGSISVFGVGYSMGVTGYTIAAGTNDIVTFGPTGPSLLYQTGQADSPALNLVVVGTSANYSFTVQTHGGTGGELVQLGIDAVAGNLTIQFGGSSSTMYTFDLTMVRQAPAGPQTFTNMGAAGAGGATVTVNYGPWTMDGMPILYTFVPPGDAGAPVMMMEPDMATATDGGVAGTDSGMVAMDAAMPDMDAAVADDAAAIPVD